MINGNLLIFNAGSTSIKYRVFDHEENELINGTIENIDNYETACKQILRQIINLGEISAVAHRIVHGGEKFREPVIVDAAVLADLESIASLAPLHNPYNIAGLKVAMDFLPNAVQVAVFDTGFFAGLPMEASAYALDPELSRKYGIYRYGFHGLSHEFILHETASSMGLKPDKLDIISVHLGGGASIAAIRRGKPIEISMGYSPNEGLVMISRSGDLNVDAVLDLIRKLPGEINRAKIDEVSDLLNRQSGIAGMSGIADFKELLSEASLGKPQASQAFSFYIQRIIKYIGAYHFLLEGKTQRIILTGNIGSGNIMTKQAIQSKLRFLGIPIDSIKTNEELMMARKTVKLLDV
jgi:acetate kinase